MAADQTSHHANSSWYVKMLSLWESLGTNLQLAIQLILLLAIFYALTCLFQCKKKSRCQISCNCGCIDSCTCKVEGNEKKEHSVEHEDQIDKTKQKEITSLPKSEDNSDTGDIE